METKIKVVDKTDIEKRLEPGDIVKSIRNDAVVLVVKVNENGKSFDGFVLEEGDYPEEDKKSLHLGFHPGAFTPFHGTITLECM